MILVCRLHFSVYKYLQIFSNKFGLYYFWGYICNTQKENNIMKRTYYHGTSADNLESILKYGLSTDEIKIWSCSNDAVYLWDAIEAAELDGYDEYQANEYGFRMANESGQIACSIAKDCRVVVLKIELDENLVEPDYSCENMADRGAKCVCSNITLDNITEIHVSNDLSLLKGYFICMLSNNEYNSCEFTPLELMVANCFKESYILEELDSYIEFTQLEIY